MLLAVANVKGGQGKSTWASTLAAWLEGELLDLDPSQGDSYGWAEAAGHSTRLVWPEDLWATLEEAAADHNWHIADCPPLEGEATRGALALARVVVVPVVPSGAPEARAWGRMLGLIEEARKGPNPSLKAAALLNAVRPRLALVDDFIKLMKDFHHPSESQWFLGVAAQRVAVADAFAAGRMPFHGSGPEAQEFVAILEKIGKIVKTV